MGSTDKRHFFSIAPEFGIYDFQLDQTYHYTSYQLCLQSAAQALGHQFTIVAPTTCTSGSAGVIPLLSQPPGCTVSADIACLISKLCLEETNERAAILLYEGSLALANEFLTLARRFPSILFVINLFLHESYYYLDSAFNGQLIPDGTGIPGKDPSPVQSFFQSSGPQAQPANLHIFTDTENKGFAARLLGITAIKRWHTFSAITNVRSARPNQNDSSLGHRVLVPLSSWQLSDELVHHMVSVKQETDAHMGDKVGIEFHLTGYLPDHEVQHWLMQLRGAGFNVTSESRPKEDYAKLYSSHDAVWLPSSWYILQSSGKALDALVQGTPIIAPIGTHGWKEQNRWVGGAPGYSTTVEARDLFLNLRFILPLIASELRRQNQAIRDCYSPSTTMLSLVSAIEK